MTNTQLLDQLYNKVLSQINENKKKIDKANGIVELSFAMSKDYTLQQVACDILMAKCDILMGKEEIE